MITEALGIKGWGFDNDRMILTSIVTGDPLLIINRFGQGKTAIIDRLGQVFLKALEKARPNEKLNFAVINAATANPQDWAGYLIPPKNLDGSEDMVLIESPQSLLNSVLIAIDELGRTQARNQNNVLTLVQERRVDGMPTKCEVLFGMMNPVMSDNTDEGSEPIIGPLADRFALLIEPKEYSAMTLDEKREVTESAYKPHTSTSIFSDPKTKKLGKDSYIVTESTSKNLWEFFTLAKQQYVKYCFGDNHKKLKDSVIEYVAQVSAMLVKEKSDKGIELYISGRRAGFLTRAILANHAIGTLLKRENLPGAAETVLNHSMMNKAMGIGTAPHRLVSAHNASRKVLKSGESVMANIMAEPNKWKRLQMAHNSKVTADEYTRIYKDVWTLYADNSQIEAVMGLAIVDGLAKKMSKHELAEIGRKIIDVCSVPAHRFNIKAENTETLEIALTIQGDSGWEATRMVALTQYISKARKIKFGEAWEFVTVNYKKAASVIHNWENFNYED